MNLPGLTTSNKGHFMIGLFCFKEYTNLSVYVLDLLPNSQAILLVVPKAFNNCVFYTKGICLSLTFLMKTTETPKLQNLATTNVQQVHENTASLKYFGDFKLILNQWQNSDLLDWLHTFGALFIKQAALYNLWLLSALLWVTQGFSCIWFLLL